MHFLSWAVDFFLHLDQHLKQVIQDHGAWTYLLLFVVVFCETGLVVTPVLPGDSLLFLAGYYAHERSLGLAALLVVLAAAAITGDTVNYWIGHWIGPPAFSGKIRFLKKKHLDRTHEFYQRHGGKTIILARFVPIIRTFAPFVAGVGSMSYAWFIAYNVIGGLAWVAAFVFGGYFFGSWPIVRDHFSLMTLAIIVISVLPIVYEIARARFSRSENGHGSNTDQTRRGR
jgi:membrane-associated protein